MSDDIKWTIERQIPHLRRYAVALSRDREYADDLVQDTLERALTKRHLWTRRGTIRSWLFRILYRTFIDHTRRRRARAETTESEILDHLISQPPNQESRIECRNIAEALDKLPEDQRAIVLLVALEGLSYDEVAEIMGVPVGTVRSRLSRGRASLRHIREGERRPALRRVK